MAQLIYQDETGNLNLGDDTNAAQVTKAVYRSRTGRVLEIRDDGVFIERTPAENTERVLFPVSRS